MSAHYYPNTTNELCKWVRCMNGEEWSYRFSHSFLDSIEVYLPLGMMSARGSAYYNIELPPEVEALELNDLLAWALIRGQM